MGYRGSDIKTLRFKDRFLWTGNLTPLRRRLFAPRFVCKYSNSELESLIKSKDRVKSTVLHKPEEYIIDQGNLGSCNGQAAAKGLERALVRAGHDHTILSGEYLYSRINGNRDQGSLLEDGMKEIMSGGVAPYKESHKGRYRSGHFSREDKEQAKQFKALECYGLNSELEMAEALADGWIVIFAVHASNNYLKMSRDGVCGRSLGVGNHAEGADDVRIKNGKFQFHKYGSWGLDTWKKGCGWITWDDHLSKPARNHFFYAIRICG